MTDFSPPHLPIVTPLQPVACCLRSQYYASKVEPIDEHSCKLTMVTWGEMCDSYSAWWVNLFNAHVFITPKVPTARSTSRLHECMHVVSTSGRVAVA